jgi:hypothetical protein
LVRQAWRIARKRNQLGCGGQAWRIARKRNQLGCGGHAGDLEVKVLYTPGKGEC